MLVGRAAGRKPTRGVLLDHLEFGRRLLHGDDVYAGWRSDPDAPERPLHAPYPPSFGLLTAPFHLVEAAFGLRAARLCWALLQLGALAWCAWTLRRLVEPRAPPPAYDSRWQWLWLGTFVLGSRFVLRDTHGGGGNLINVALGLAAFAASERGANGRAGLWLAVSLVTKPTMLWLVPLLLVFRRWRTLAFTATWAAGLLLVTLLLLRGDTAPFTRWFAGSVAMATQADPWSVPAYGFPPFEWMNQALRFCVARWCGDVPPEFAARVAWGVPAGLGLPVVVVGWLVRTASLLLVLAVLATAWRARRDAAARLWSVAGTLVLTLLLSPIAWKGHHVALLPVLVLVLHAATRPGRGLVRTALGLWFVVCALPGGDLVGDDADEWLNSLYVVTVGDLLLLGLALAFAWRSAQSAAQEHHDAAIAGELAQ
ncbi:MAG: glycosyltransferase family 87 protein [Planctomycetota bacterium]